MHRLLRRLPRPAKAVLRETGIELCRLRNRIGGKPPGIVFLLAHMRSGSTLVSHILSSHPLVLGCGERNATYASPRDLDRLEADARYTRRQFLHSYRYVIDQINHTRFLPAEELLNHPRVSKIFLIREPRDSIASMADVLGRHYGTTVDEAVAYYLERLQALARYSELLENRDTAIALTYEGLLAHPEANLLRLSDFLGLEPRLSQRYRRFAFTGSRGDPSETIQEGRIVTDRPQRHMDLSTDDLARVRAVYDLCRATLMLQPD
ncbi:MAG: sulfotransferase domain-containing protein [Gemmatimonadota bacterium]|nr:MAG: sulfotransferase domain-containing protein [Gemmatimonadota bacterium]